MGFYLRKSVSFGPLRLNFSKSGVGLSAGVTGARVSIGPRGTYIHAGRGGFYYRQRLDSGGRPPQEGLRQHARPAVDQLSSDAVPTAEAADLVPASADDVLATINKCASRLPLAPWVGAMLVLLLLSLLGSGQLALSLLTLIVGTSLVIYLHNRDKIRRTASLVYELDLPTQHWMDGIQAALDTLGQSVRVWRVEGRQFTDDWKRNAGASSLIRRRPVRVGVVKPPYISTNLQIKGIDLGQLRLLFFSDWLLIYQSGRYGAVSYDTIGVNHVPVRFIEEEIPPRDAQIVDQTWRYVRKNGGPDLRFNNNRQLPVMLYGHLELTSSTGLNIHLDVSNVQCAGDFAQSFQELIQRGQFSVNQLPDEPQTNGRNEKPKSTIFAAHHRDPHEVLGVRSGASREEVTTAYYHLLRQYSPGNVSKLPPGLKVVAERRSQELSDAYGELRRIWGDSLSPGH